MNKQIYSTIVAVVLCGTPIWAQTQKADTINRLVLVESIYNPEVGKANKMNFLPEAVQPAATQQPIRYAEEAQPLTSFTRSSLQAQGVALPSANVYPGYFHFGFGTPNLLDGKAFYQVQLGERDLLQMDADVQGWSGHLKPDFGDTWRSNLHTIGTAVSYQHLFQKATLTVQANYGHHTYNYLTDKIYTAHTRWQTSNVWKAFALLDGSTADDDWDYLLQVNYSHWAQQSWFGWQLPNDESHYQVKADLSKDTEKWGRVGAQMHNHLFFYNGLPGYRDYYTGVLTPYWSFENEQCVLFAGLNVDVQTANGKGIMVSPNVRLTLKPTDFLSTTLALDGGRSVNTMEQLYAFSPYWASKRPLDNAFTLLNARLDVNARLMEGLHLNLFGSYRINRKMLFEDDLDSLGVHYTGLVNRDAKVAELGAKTNYMYKDLWSASAEYTYYHWNISGDRELYIHTPSWVLNLSAKVRAMDKLYAHAGFYYTRFNKVNGQAEPSVADLSAGADYVVNSQLTMFLQGSNLLNKSYDLYHAYPNLGINGMVGVRLKF